MIGLLLLTFACDDDDQGTRETKVTFTELGLEGKTVHELNLVGDALFAATDDGLFVKDLSTDADWELAGLEDENVKAFVAIDEDTYLASVTVFGTLDHHLFKSTDGGESWIEVETNFGGLDPEGMADLEYNSTTEELFAVGVGVVAKSTDLGESWEPMYGEWGAFASGMDFVAQHPQSGNLWASGQNGIEQFSLVKYEKSSDAWEEWVGLLRSPSVGKDIAFDPGNNTSLIVGGEHGIIHSSNEGDSWTTILEDHADTTRFYFGVDYDKNIKDRIYAASWLKEFTNPQPLILKISEDGGENWKEFRHNDNDLMGGVYDMLQVKEGNKTLLYLGLFKGGVYLATVEN
ncbi:WD40/YVTN/BNR-like repeat-containing protein [Catalinimonas niigatensis]|uniref:WD40/YVTN/BNR-like repeat-containing protein n=1 Tax=Catalinimonas niigatensis TaxID=1397264 RepID=UPI002666B3BB|nr:hypothetical protein [Catalinimonas niigatensis]WPP52259.1 hypothetical protein PZB72_07680 [Catalinimonas niigatensis]